ncbi:MAG: MFS transporter [Oceanococcus sp.]
MRQTLLPITALLASVAMLFTANGLLGVLLPLRATFLGFSPVDIGFMGTAYFSGFVVGCLLGPRLVRRVGHIRTFAALVAIVCSLTLLMGLMDGKLVWWLSRGVIGMCFATSYIVIESWLNDRASNENRGFVFSVYTIINLSVITLGQLAITLASFETLVLFAVAAILVSLATVPVVVSAAQAPALPTTVNVRLRYLFERSRVAIVACVGVGMANGAFWTLGPLFAQSDRGDTRTTAIFMSLTVIAGALGQWPLGHLSDRMDRRWIIIWASLGASVGAAVLVGFGSSGLLAIYIGSFLFGAFAFPLYALCAAHLNDFIDEGGYVEAASGLLLMYSAGAIVGPLIASAMMNVFGPKTLYIYTACIHLLVASYALHRVHVRQPTAEAGQTSFNDALVISSLSADIDPRTHEEEPS